MNTVGLSSVSIKSNNSKDFRALGRNSKSQSLCRDQRAVKSQLCIKKLNFCKSFCSEVSVWGWVLLLVLCGKHSEGHWVSAIKKISACLWKAGAECYSLDQLCVVTTTVQLFPGTSQPQSRDTPLLLLTPLGPAVPPALTSLLPALCHCPHPRRAMCSGASAAPGGQGSPQPGACCVPSSLPTAQPSRSLFQLSFGWAAEDQQQHCTAPQGCSVPMVVAVPTAEVGNGCRSPVAVGTSGPGAGQL